MQINKISGVYTNVKYRECNTIYIGKTGRNFDSRLKEYTFIELK